MTEHRRLPLFSSQPSLVAPWEVVPIHEQVVALGREFDLPTDDAVRFLAGRFSRAFLPPVAKGWFALPAIEATADRWFPAVPDPRVRYQRLTEWALERVSQRLPGFGTLECRSTPEKFALPERTARGLASVRVFQKGSILILPIGFAKRPDEYDTSSQPFPLGSFLTACLGLTHGGRYADAPPRPPSGGVECTGFGKVGCGTCWFDDARARWDRAMGLVPQFMDLPGEVGS